MVIIWVGALLLIAGVVYMAAQPLWRGRLSSPKGSHLGQPTDTLEPSRPSRGFGLKANWPGLALAAAGGILLLAAAAIRSPT